MRYLDTERKYRHIIIVESRNWWVNCSMLFDATKDLVLTYDLALQREITVMGGKVFYIDHLISKEMMQENNFRTYRFFREWHLDATCEDIFIYRDVPFGFAFRIEIWNDLLSYVLTSANLGLLRGLRFEKVFVGTELGFVESILSGMSIPYISISRPQKKDKVEYYFPIHRWMDSKVRATHYRHKVKKWFLVIHLSIHKFVISWFDRVLERRRSKLRIFLQLYHPTRNILQKLKKDPNLTIILGCFTRFGNKKYLTQRIIPVFGKVDKYSSVAEKLMEEFRIKRIAKLVLADNSDITLGVYSVIEDRITNRILEYLRDLNCVIDYLDRNPIQLGILISNIGRIDTLVDCVCKKRNVPSYLIINGLLGPEYLDESKYATVINAYSLSIKNNYFKGMSNVVCLGDPRMDNYMTSTIHKDLNRDSPTVTIGASGFNIIDLNSYVAVEFEFLWDVLQALQNIKLQDVDLRIVIKVRANGYPEQYKSFVEEFFPGLVDEIHSDIPMDVVLEKTDLYISISSQTLFEASCLGIPCIFYNTQEEILNVPFDGNSELVTVDTIEGLEQCIRDFRSGHKRFDAFLKRSIMEKYIGPLDGKNTSRNIDFIYGLLKGKQPGVQR